MFQNCVNQPLSFSQSVCSLKEKTHLLQGSCAREGLQLLLTFKGAKKNMEA